MKQRALIIEDNEDNRVLMQFILEHNGYQATFAEDGKSGIEKVAAGGMDFVLLDIQLPDMDGLAVLQAIRCAKDSADMPVVAMTSFALAGDEVRFIKAGFTGYIEKPIDPQAVIEQIRAVLEKRASL